MMVTEAWKKATELRHKALESGKQADLDAALAAQCAAEKDDLASEAPDTSRQLTERLARVGREIDEVERDVLAVEGARSELHTSPAAAYYPRYIEGNPAPGALPATESPKTTRRRMNMVRKANQEGAAGAAEGTGEKQKRPRATGADLAHKRLDVAVKAIQKLGQTSTKGFVPEDKFKAAFVQIRKLVDDAEAKMVAERAAPKVEAKEDQLKLAF